MLYYILENKERKGPFSLEQLAEMEISPDTMVWCKGMANWMKASEVEELAEILTSNHVENIKCKECGELFNANLTECPNCGCPASESVEAGENEDSEVNPDSTSNNDKQEGKGYVDVESDNVFVGIFHWFSPSNISLPYNSKPTKVTVAVDNDAEDVFEIEKSLFYMLHAFCLKLFFCYLGFFLLLGAIFFKISDLVYNACDDYDDYKMATVFIAILACVGIIISIIAAFMIFLYIFRPYWSHIHVRLRDLHIRHWRNIYRAIKNEEK